MAWVRFNDLGRPLLHHLGHGGDVSKDNVLRKWEMRQLPEEKAYLAYAGKGPAQKTLVLRDTSNMECCRSDV